MTISAPLSEAVAPTEQFLRHYHDARPGRTPLAFAHTPVTLQDSQGSGQTFPSTYESLQCLVPTGPAPLTVLDLACGDGFLLEGLARRRQPGLSLLGVDISLGELAAARMRLDAGEGNTPVQLLQTRAQALPFETGSIDIVLCHMALMLMDEMPRVLEQLQRVLKPGGLLAGVVGSRSPSSPVLTAFLAVMAEAGPTLAPAIVAFGDPGWRTLDGIQTLLQPPFTMLEIDTLSSEVRMTPEEHWAYFSEMYDLQQQSEERRAQLQARFVELLLPACDGEGRVTFRGQRLRIQARL